MNHTIFVEALYLPFFHSFSTMFALVSKLAGGARSFLRLLFGISKMDLVKSFPFFFSFKVTLEHFNVSKVKKRKLTSQKRNVG